MSSNILDTNTQRCYYPETGTYKQEVCSPYNQLAVIRLILFNDKRNRVKFKKNMWLYITLFGACAAALGSFMLARQGGVQTDRIESLQRQTKTEVTNLKYSIPEKLFVKFELTFRFSEEVDFSEILKNYNDNYYLFRFPIQTPEHKAIHSTVSKRLAILQVSGGIMNSSEYSVLIINGKKKMNYSSVPQANNIIKLNFPKEINFQY